MTPRGPEMAKIGAEGDEQMVGLTDTCLTVQGHADTHADTRRQTR